MTTKSIKPVTRETSAFVRDRGLRAIIVTVHHGVLLMRAKGLRTEETVDIGSLYHRAVKERVMRELAEKKAARRARRTGK